MRAERAGRAERAEGAQRAQRAERGRRGCLQAWRGPRVDGRRVAHEQVDGRAVELDRQLSSSDERAEEDTSPQPRRHRPTPLSLLLLLRRRGRGRHQLHRRRRRRRRLVFLLLRRRRLRRFRRRRRLRRHWSPVRSYEHRRLRAAGSDPPPADLGVAAAYGAALPLVRALAPPLCVRALGRGKRAREEDDGLDAVRLKRLGHPQR
eukprot:scaffold24034_cov57-Phaeocystis_antarctica.AAC.6